MELLETQSLVGVILSVVAIGIAAFYVYSSWKKNTVFATSSQLHREKYDIFISFRGSDIRDGFLSHLKKQLRREGIDFYVDERLECGDKISSALWEAIERSVIALVIFSKDYASSRWCLEELVKIMECKRVDSKIVIPVFYKVDPSHVRHQKGSYAESFSQHKQKIKDNDLLQVWRSILKETAELSGYHSSNFLNESDLIDGITKDISKMLEDKDTIKANHLIGFKENLATIESFMKVDSREVRVLGLWGKGGMGKTTLAHAIFDKFSHQFESSYFASNVREESKRNGLTCVLEKILCALLNDENITKIGKPNTLRRLRRIRVLLVLDDVDTSRQLHDLMKENLSLGPRSKVIITSRDRHVLVSGGVHVLHEVKELNVEESLQLFCQHAFNQAYPQMGYERLSAQAIKYARGLPLALKVLGSYFYSKDSTKWDSALKKFRKYPLVEIQTVLRMSYDALDMSEKKIFLDIAFFFKGKTRDDIVRVLDACEDLHTDCGIDSLLDKALITISRDNEVEIHDLLQEMAEEIVREESREYPERRSRLNDAKEIQDVLENNKGCDATEGIILNIEKELYLSADTFHKMRSLRFLKIEPSYIIKGSQFVNHTVYLLDGLGSLSNELRYFSWRGYPLKSLPQGFSPTKLVEIHMLYSKVSKLWDGVQDLMNLKIVVLKFSEELKELPDFSNAQNLEIVDLSYCGELREIHPSILSLPKLISLNLMDCRKLKKLHGDNHLESLEHLTLKGCIILEKFLLSSVEMTSLNLFETNIKTLSLPIGRFNKLEELHLGGVRGCLRRFQINELSCLTSLKKFFLTNFEEGIDKSKLIILFDAWPSLEGLYLNRCRVSEIPDNISNLSLLKVLSLRGCDMESLPNSIKHLSWLKKVDVGECKRLRSLPELPPSIAQFYADECTSLEAIDFIRPTISYHDGNKSSLGLDRSDMTQFIHFIVMRAIYNNSSCEVRVCYPGSTIPKGFMFSQMAESSIITIEHSPPSSDHLLGFASCCILPSSDFSYGNASVCRKFHFGDDEINYKDEEVFPCISKLKTDNVFVWYDPMERIIKETPRRQLAKGTTYKFACTFFVGDSLCYSRVDEYDDLIKRCGIWPIYASELQEILQQMELKQQKGTETKMPEPFDIIIQN